MKKSFKIASTLLVMALATTSFVFANGEKETKGNTASASQPANISFMWWGNETRNEATTNAVNDFMAENPDVKVSVMPNPYSGYHDKILLQLANGTAPDVFCFSTQWMNEVGFEDTPALLDLYTQKDLIDFSDIDTKLLSGGEGKGKLLGVPTGISGWNYSYFEKPIAAYMAKSGAAAPPTIGESWTMDEFIAYGEDFHKVMGEDYYFINYMDSIERIFVSCLSEIANNFYIDPNGNLMFTEDDVLKTCDLMLEMTEKGVFPTPTLQVEFMSGASSLSQMMAEGKFAGVHQWTSNVIDNEVQAEDTTVSMAYPILGRAENDGVFVRPAQFWAINRTSKNPEAAARLLNYIVNSQKAAMDLGVERSVPPTSAARKTLKDAGLLVGNTYDSTNYLVEEAGASYNWFIMVPEIMNTIKNTYTNMVLGKIDDKEAAHTIYTKSASIMEEIQKNYDLK